MALDQTQAFASETGFQAVDGDTLGPLYTGGPSAPGSLNLPVQSVYVQVPATGGCILWRKYGTGATDWVRQDQADFSQYNESLAQTDITSSTYSSKVSITIPATAPTGTYRFTGSWNSWCDGLFSGGNVRVLVGATTVFTRALDGNQRLESILRRIAFTTGTAVTIAVQINQTGGTAHIINASLELERVA